MAAAGGSAGSATAVTDPGSEGDGEVTVGPDYTTQADLRAGNAPAGKTFSFTMNSSDSKIFTGLDATLTAPKAFSRLVTVYVPAKYKDGTAAPFMTIQDGARAHYNLVRLAVENLSQSTDPARRLPAIIVVAIHNGPGDGKGSERGLEYDTMSNRYGRFVDEEVLPAVLANAQIKAAYPNLKFTDDPEGRGTVGCSSGAAAAVIQAWLEPDKFRKVIAYSATLVAQQADDAPESAQYPHGAWDLHSDLALIANSEKKPIRMVIGANQMDNGAGTGEANRHDWLLANQRTAAALKAKGYHYRSIYGLGAAHCTQGVENATMADSMLWLWRGYPTQ
jgi:enterochelin esterase-like enzyme